MRIEAMECGHQTHLREALQTILKLDDVTNQ